MSAHKVRSVLLAFSLAVAGPSLSAETVRVFAAASLSDALTEVLPIARTQGLDISLNLAGSGTLVRQVLEGARADVILTADEISMERLVLAGKVAPGDVKPLLNNILVVAASLETPVLVSASDLSQPRFRRIAMADETTAPAGLYARNTLKAEGLWAKIASRVVPTENVRGALAALEAGNAQAAVVYLTDVRASRTAHVVWEFRGKSAPDILYPVAVARLAPNPDAARRLLALLESPAAREIFARHGFGFPASK